MTAPLDFAEPPRKMPVENIVPMINVVFLLLIFFLMTATMRAPAPVEITPPESRLGAEPAPPRERAIYLDMSGVLHWGALTGDAALAGLAAEGTGSLVIHADRQADAVALARLLGDLAEGGFGETRLVVTEIRE